MNEHRTMNQHRTVNNTYSTGSKEGLQDRIHQLQFEINPVSNTPR